MNPRVAVLVKRFPKLSETFIQGEIESLVARNSCVSIMSMFEPNEKILQPVDQSLLDRVRYLKHTPLIWAWIQLITMFIQRPNSLKSLVRFRATGGSLRLLGQIIHICQQNNIEHIHAHYLSEPSVLAEMVQQLCGIPFSISAHAKDIYLTNKKDVCHRVEKAKFISTCTGHNVSNLKALVSNPDKVHLVYHGINTSFFHNMHKPKQHPPVIIAVGRFKKKKGFDVLIKACQKLMLNDVSFTCELIGYGEEAANLQYQIDSTGLANHVKLCPPVNHTELVTRLNEACVFVLPCRVTKEGDRDGIPNSLLEAMACELPIVTTDVSGIPEVVEDKKNGRLINSDSAKELVSVLLDLLNNPLDRRRLGKAARAAVVDRFSWDTNITELQYLLNADTNTAVKQKPVHSVDKNVGHKEQTVHETSETFRHATVPNRGTQ